MATESPIVGLRVPSGDDNINVELDIAENMTKIDQAIGDIKRGVSELDAPPDDFESPATLHGAWGTVRVRNNDATTQPGEPPEGDIYSLWYVWQSTYTGTASFDTYGSVYDPLPEWYNPDTGDEIGLDTKLDIFKVIPPIPGTNAQWHLDQETPAPTGGTYTVTIQGETSGTIPWNADATAVFNIVNAMNVVGNGDLGVSGAGGVSALANGGVQFNFTNNLGRRPITMSANGAALTGPNAPYVLAMTPTQVGTYTIPAPPVLLENLVPVETNDDSEGKETLNSAITFEAESTTTYYIRVSGYDEDSKGIVYLNWYPAGVVGPPGPAGPSGSNTLAGLVWNFRGVLSSGLFTPYYPLFTGTITQVRLNSRVAGTGDVVFDLKKNGATIYPTTPKPRIPAGQLVGSITVPDIPGFTSSDKLEPEIIQTGNAVDLVANIEFTRS